MEGRGIYNQIYLASDFGEGWYGNVARSISTTVSLNEEIFSKDIMKDKLQKTKIYTKYLAHK